MNDPYMFKWFIFTNIVMAIAPGMYWERRQTQVGASRGLAIVIMLGTINSFIPNNMWAIASPAFSIQQNPWFYLIGVVAILYSVHTIFVYNRLSKKPKTIGSHKTVW